MILAETKAALHMDACTPEMIHPYFSVFSHSGNVCSSNITSGRVLQEESQVYAGFYQKLFLSVTTRTSDGVPNNANAPEGEGGKSFNHNETPP